MKMNNEKRLHLDKRIDRLNSQTKLLYYYEETPDEKMLLRAKDNFDRIILIKMFDNPGQLYCYIVGILDVLEGNVS